MAPNDRVADINEQGIHLYTDCPVCGTRRCKLPSPTPVECAWCVGPLGDTAVMVSHPHQGTFWYHTGCWNDRVKKP